MPAYVNHLGQPVGFPLPRWNRPPKPQRVTIEGRFCRLEPLDAKKHAEALYWANAADHAGAMWTYLAYGPFKNVDDYTGWLSENAQTEDPLFYTIIAETIAHPVGVASYLRIAPESGSIEVGHLAYSPTLQRTAAATEAMYLMMKHAFELGYRRYEWKCDALNAKSRAAALRLGFTFEGIFRQATVYKGRNRDTVWYSILDCEWPALRRLFEDWLDPANFDEQGHQRKALRAS